MRQCYKYSSGNYVCYVLHQIFLCFTKDIDMLAACLEIFDCDHKDSNKS